MANGKKGKKEQAVEQFVKTADTLEFINELEKSAKEAKKMRAEQEKKAADIFKTLLTPSEKTREELEDQIDEIDPQDPTDTPIKQYERHKKKSERKLLKTPFDLQQDFFFKERLDIAKDFEKIQNRFENNNQRVGNAFTEQYDKLRERITGIQVLPPKSYKDSYFSQVITKYGLDGLAKQSLRCILENDDVIPAAWKEQIASTEKGIQDFQSFLGKADETARFTASLADDLLGEAEEIYDATREIRKQHIDYKAKRKTLKKSEIASINRVRSNSAKRLFLDTILPFITSRIADSLESILQNTICSENESRRPPSFNTEELAKLLKEQYGAGSAERPNFASMILDISAFLTPLEMCRLLNGGSKEETLDRIQYFISVFYKKNYAYFNTKQKISNFFTLLGSTIDPEVCIEVELAALPGDKCLDVESPVSEFQRCLSKKELNELNKLKQQFLEVKKTRFEKLLRLSFGGADQEIGQALADSLGINKSSVEERVINEAIEKYKNKLYETLQSASKLYTKNIAIEEKISSQKIPEQIEDILSSLPKSQREDLEKKIKEGIKSTQPSGTSGQVVSREEKFIFPGLEDSMFLRNKDIVREDFESATIVREYDSSKQVDRTVANMFLMLKEASSAGAGNFDFLKVIDNFQFSSTSYHDLDKLRIDLSGNKDKSTYTFDRQEKVKFYNGDELGPLAVTNFGGASPSLKNKISNFRGKLVQDFIKANDSLGSLEKVLKTADLTLELSRGNFPIRTSELSQRGDPEIEKLLLRFKPEGNLLTHSEEQSVNYKNSKASGKLEDLFWKNKYNTAADKYFKLKTNHESFKQGLRTCYNQLANICMNSVFAKKIPYGITSRRSDSGKLSGLEIIKIAPDPTLRTESCAEIDLNIIPMDQLAKKLMAIDFKDYQRYFVDDSAEKQRYLSFLINFKSYVLDFILKSIFFFSEFSLEEEGVDDMMVDYVYISMFRSLYDADQITQKDNREFQKLSEAAKEDFFDKIRIQPFIEKKSLSSWRRESQQLEDDIADVKDRIAKTKASKVLSAEDRETNIEIAKTSLVSFLKGCRYTDKEIDTDPQGVGKYNIYNAEIGNFEEVVGEGAGSSGVTTRSGACSDEIIQRRVSNFRQTVKDNTLEEQERLFEEAVREEKELEVQLRSKLAFYQELIDRNTLKFADKSYEMTSVLLHFYNSQYPDSKTKDFCDAIRALIRTEISETSKQLKELAYTEKRRDEKIFNLEDRYLENKINLAYVPGSMSFEDKIPFYMQNFAKKIKYEHPYYDRDEYLHEDFPKFLDFQVDYTTSQIGKDFFFLTNVDGLEEKAESVTVEVYIASLKHKGGMGTRIEQKIPYQSGAERLFLKETFKEGEKDFFNRYLNQFQKGSGDIKKFDVWYQKQPVVEFSVDTTNIGDFNQNYEKKHGVKPTLERYFHSCLKHQIIKRIKEEYTELHESVFPLRKFASHLTISMNRYAKFLGNLENEFGQDVEKHAGVTKQLSDFSLFSIDSLAGILAGSGVVAAISSASLAAVREKYKNISALQAIAQTQTTDLSLYFVKSAIKNHMSILERSEPNLQVSKKQAEAVSYSFLSIYSKIKKISGAAGSLASTLGVSPPNQGLLDTSLDDIATRYLFKPYVTPFAIANWIYGLVPLNIAAWVQYVVGEIALISLEIAEDLEFIQQLEGYVFSETDTNSINPIQKKFAMECAAAIEAAKKANPIIESDLFTNGNEYMLPDGRDYVGDYHIHKDGTVMAGPDHPEEGHVKVVLTKIIEEE